MDAEQDGEQGGARDGDRVDVAVAGAGLAGLTAARRLAETGHDVAVYETHDAVGGRVRSTRRDGWTFDRGFQVLFTGYPAVRRELDLEALDLRRYRPGAVLAGGDGRSVVADPLRDPAAAVATIRNPAVPLRDGLRLLRLRWRLGRCGAEALERRADAADDRSIRAYLDDAGFSDRVVERFLGPFYGGITLDRSLATSAYVFVATFGALSRGAIAVPAEGMGAIPRQLADAARRAGARIQTGRAVQAVEQAGDGVALTVGEESVTADATVVATDPPTARDLTGVQAVPAAGHGCVTQHVAVEEPLGTGRRLVLRSNGDGGEHRAPAHVAPASAVAPEYSDGERELVTATYLGEPDADDGALASRTRTALADWFPERDLAPEVLRTDRVPFAQFLQPPGFRAGRPGVRAPDGPVYLAGDHTAWSSIQGALASGGDAARAVRDDLEP